MCSQGGGFGTGKPFSAVIYVLDASAMIAFLRAEPGGEVMHGILQTDGNRIVAHSINLCEVYYDFFRAGR